VRTRLQERFAITWQSDWNMGNAMAYTRWWGVDWKLQSKWFPFDGGKANDSWPNRNRNILPGVNAAGRVISMMSTNIIMGEPLPSPEF
jgi:hypothetical protein